MDTQEMEQVDQIASVCGECGAERPTQPHDPLCPLADTDTIVSTGTDDDTDSGPAVAHEPIGIPPTPITPIAPRTNVGRSETNVGWILRLSPEHHCILPTIDDRTFVGSIWRCGDCGQDYLVYQKRGKQAGTKAFKKITAEKADELLAKHSS